MELFRLFGSILIDNDEANRSISATTRNAEGFGSKLTGGIKTAAKWGAAIVAGATLAGAAIGAMAIPLVKAAANAKAMDAQFGQVFGDIAKQSTDTLNKIAKETGMLPNRLKGSFTQIAAFAKTTGMETAEALALTERATLAAADSAAFYDKSIEEVSETLQSYLKGNYANDAALGIASTETTRNAAANKLYGKSFKDLGEAQKQLTLLQMVEDGNKLSGALGQAALESSSFENQLGNLKQAWEDIKVKFGQPLLEPVVKIIQTLAEALANVDVKPIIAKFESFVSFLQTHVVSKLILVKDTVVALYKAFMSVFNDTGKATDILTKIGISPGSAAKIETFFKGLLDGFEVFKSGVSLTIDTVSALFESFMSVLRGTGGTVNILTKIGISPGNAAKIVTFFKELLNGFEVFKSGASLAIDTVRALFDTFMSVLRGTGGTGDILTKIGLSPEVAGKIETFFASLIGFFKTSFTVISAILGGFKSATMTIFNFIQPYIMPILSATVGFIQEQLAKITGFWNENGQQIMQAVSNLFNGIMAVIQFVMPVVEFLIVSIWGNIKGVISGALDVIMGVVKIFTGVFTGDFSKMWEGVKQLFFGALQFLWNLFSLMMFGKLLGGIKAFAASGLGLFKSFGTAIKGTFKDFINTIVTLFHYFRATGSSIWSATIGVIKNLVSSFVVAIKSNFSNILTNTTSVFSRIKDAILNPIRTAKNAVKGFIDEIKGFFSKMSLKLPKIKMPSFKIKNWSKNPADWLKAMPSLGVEWNAKGGIFNKPTIFNTAAGLQGVGEAGSEAILPLNAKTLAGIGRGIADTMSINQTQPIHVTIISQLNSREVARETYEDITRFQELDKSMKSIMQGG